MHIIDFTFVVSNVEISKKSSAHLYLFGISAFWNHSNVLKSFASC